MYKYSTLVEMFVTHFDTSDRGITFVKSAKSEIFVSYQELTLRGRKLLAELQVKGLQRGDELIFQIDDNETFVVFYIACIFGGFIAVPVTQADTHERCMKLIKIKETLNNPYLATNRQSLDAMRMKAEDLGIQNSFEELATKVIYIEDAVQSEKLGHICQSHPEDIAFVQFSSGSTGDPKGVVLSHHNLIANMNAIAASFHLSSLEIGLSWMPLTHDMGLIGVLLTNFYAGINQILIPPALFVKRPALWLKKIHEHRATWMTMPNFGIKHVLSFSKYETMTDLDLSSVRVIANGAEPVNIELCEEFMEAMSRFNLPRHAMLPVYGLAEASVAVSTTPCHENYQYVIADRRFLGIGETVVETDRENEHHVTFANVGYPVLDCSVRICDDENQVLSDNVVGYIQIHGSNVTRGYYNNPEATAKVILQDGWLNTGDLGFMCQGRLVITGRAKDIIFINGQNLYPHDIERVAEELEEVSLGKVAASGVYDPESGREEVVLFVLSRATVERFIPLAIQLRYLINRRFGLSVQHVVPVSQIPRTTSGKIQRYKLSEEFVEGKFSEVAKQVSQQIEEFFENRQVVSPRSQLEEELVAIWSELLGIRKVGIDDNFLELGGNSNLVVKMVSLLDQKYPNVLTVADTFSLPTISKIAEFMETKLQKSDRTDHFVQGLQFPTDYFTGEAANGFAEVRSNRFTFDIEPFISEKLKDIALDLQVKPADFLAAIYIHLLSKVTDLQQVPVQLLLEEETAITCQVELDDDEPFEKWVLRVRDLREQSQKTYRLNDLLKTLSRKLQNVLTPLLSFDPFVQVRTEWLNVFDYLLTVREQANAFTFTCDFDGRRLDQSLLKNMHESYLKIIEAVVNRYELTT